MAAGSRFRRVERTEIIHQSSPYVAAMCIRRKLQEKKYEEVENCIQEIIKTFSTSPLGFLLLNLYYTDVRKNSSLAIANLARAADCNPSWDEKFWIFHFRRLSDEGKGRGANYMDVSAYIAFEKHSRESDVYSRRARNSLVSS